MEKLITFFNLKPNVNELWVNASGDFQPTEGISFNKKVTREEVLGLTATAADAAAAAAAADAAAAAADAAAADLNAEKKQVVEKKNVTPPKK